VLPVLCQQSVSSRSTFLSLQLMDAASASLPALQRTVVKEIGWADIDKQRFFLLSTASFTSLSALLHPLTVLKTRRQVETQRLSFLSTVRTLVAHEGVTALWRGYSTVLFGSFPTRLAYIGVLEASRARLKAVDVPGVSPALRNSIADFLAGATASTMSQAIVIPIDVVSQRLMVQNGEGGARNGFAVARAILRTDGLRGLYRGASVSLAIYVPTSGLWWAAYGRYQQALWLLAEKTGAESVGIVPVQFASSILASATTTTLTQPLDVIKTMLQTQSGQAKQGAGDAAPAFRSVARAIVREEGFRGLYRGLGTRMVSAAAFGSVFTQAYEGLKRWCYVPPT